LDARERAEREAVAVASPAAAAAPVRT